MVGAVARALLSPWQVILGGVLLTGIIAATWLPGSRRGTAHPAMQRFLLPAITVALVAAFYLFPIARTRWGDAFMLAKGIAFPDPSVRLTHSWQAPLDVFLHAQTWLALHGPLGWKDAMPAYRLLSPLAGLSYLLVTLALSRQFARHHLAPPWLTYGMLATLGLLQLFFGYVENYSFAAAGILAYLWLGLGVLVDRRPLWLAATVLAITNATHPVDRYPCAQPALSRLAPLAQRKQIDAAQRSGNSAADGLDWRRDVCLDGSERARHLRAAQYRPAGGRRRELVCALVADDDTVGTLYDVQLGAFARLA